MERIINYREFLTQPIARLFLHKIVESVSVYPEDFPIVYELVKEHEEKVSWRAAWACQKIFDKYPDFLEDKQAELISIVMTHKHSGKRRVLLSILLELPGPDPFPVDFLDFCFERMLDQNEPIAIQALCIKIAYKLCLLEPDLLPELKLYLENAELEYYPPGVKSCIRNVLKRLN